MKARTARFLTDLTVIVAIVLAAAVIAYCATKVIRGEWL